MAKEKPDPPELIEQRARVMPLYKKIIFSLLPLAFLLILVETGARWVYYQSHGGHKSAAMAAFYKLSQKVSLAKSENKVKDLNQSLPKGVKKGLYRPEGQELLAYFKGLYEESFVKLVEDTSKLGSKLVVLYIPSDFNKDSSSREACRSFFGSLADKHKVDFLDVTGVFEKYPVKMITLLPQNGHLSRFGNQVVVEALGNIIEKYAGHRMQAISTTRPALLGDLSAQDNKIWLFDPLAPYRVVVNSQGLRLDHDLQFPKKKSRILCLGDSFTFGPYLPNYDTYPGLLQQRYPDKEVINAGICGYTIADEASLFKERAQYCEPDITVIQVLDNDLSDFFYFKRQIFAREKRDYQPAAVEEEYFVRMRAQEKAATAK